MPVATPPAFDLPSHSAAVAAELSTRTTMSNATGRFLSLLSTSLPLRHLSSRYRPSLLSLSLSRSSLHLPRRFHFNAHAQTPSNDQFSDYAPSSSSAFSPWPEWHKLLNSFQFARYSGRLHGNLASGDDEFVDGGASLPGDFLRSAFACLEFAREHASLLWSLSRKDVEIVVENGAPFLFKDATDAMRRMKLFLYGSTDQVLGYDRPSTVDVMKFLLSYASTALASSGTYTFNNREIVEESVRRLFNQLAEISGARESTLPGSLPRQFPGTNGQPPNSSEQHSQMKRGDWICSRCSFMNFARNMKCLECEEARPKRQLTGGEWECPHCDFFNYGRNSVCLRCDCKKPAMSNPMAGSSYNNYTNNESSHKQSGQNQERAQSWFHKISQLENMPNEDDSSTDKAILENFPFKEGVISESNTPNQVANESLDFKISQRFDKILQQSTASSGASGSPSSREFPENMPIRKGDNRFVVREKEDRSLTSPLYKRRMEMEQSKSSNYVPFVPFPPNYFSKDQNPTKEESPAGNSYTYDQRKAEPRVDEQTNYSAPVSQQARDQKSEKTGGLWRGSSLEGSAVKEPDPLDMSEEAKAERWFKRVAQIKDIKELSEIPDEDFPSIMPMRKGVNRFVVSKRKTPLERRLASSQYRRNLPVVRSDPMKDDGDNES